MHAASYVREAKKQWEALPPRDRLAIFLRMGHILSTDFRPVLNAATILGQVRGLPLNP